MRRTREEVLKEIKAENATLPTERLDIRCVPADVELQRVPMDAPEDRFVFMKKTDRTRFVGIVAARLTADPEDEYFIQRAIVFFQRGITEEFAMEIAIEIERLVRADKDELDSIEHSLQIHINTTHEMIETFKENIIL